MVLPFCFQSLPGMTEMPALNAESASSTAIDLETIIDNVSCLSGLSRESRIELFRHAAIRVYKDKEAVFMQGDPAEFLFIVLSGFVRLSYIFEDGTQAFLGILQSGECIGELGVCERGIYAETAAAIGESCMARISVRAFESCFDDIYTRNRELAGMLAARYRNYLNVTCDLSLTSLAERLSRVLLKLVKCLGAKMTVNGREFSCLSPLITQSDLGSMARGTRTNVNRTLKEWERSGWILLKDRCIVLLNPSRLESVAGRN
jgi:CRP/FNR family transcriptional regulator, cyclic AMP receptor protein